MTDSPTPDHSLKRAIHRKFHYLSDLGILCLGIVIGLCLAGQWIVALGPALLVAAAWLITWIEDKWNIYLK